MISQTVRLSSALLSILRVNSIGTEVADEIARMANYAKLAVFSINSMRLLGTKGPPAIRTCNQFSPCRQMVANIELYIITGLHNLKLVLFIIRRQASLVPNEAAAVSVKAEKTSKAMKAYIQRAQEHDEFMRVQEDEYRIGKRHLANMMGEDPETFTQDDVNVRVVGLIQNRSATNCICAFYFNRLPSSICFHLDCTISAPGL